MKNKSKTAPVHLPTDSKELKKQLSDLEDKGYKVLRPNQHQIKVATFNWYWSTGSITIDPCHKHHEKGFDAFLALIEASASREIRVSFA